MFINSLMFMVKVTVHSSRSQEPMRKKTALAIG